MCCLKMLVVEGHYAHDVLPHTFNMDVFKCIKNNYTSIKHIYNEYANLIDSWGVVISDW